MELDKFKKKLGLRLKELRLARNMKQEQMEEFGFSYRYYGRVERGLVNPTIETLLRLCAIFEVSLDDLVRFMDDSNASEEAESIAAKTSEILRKGDPEKLRKLNVFLNDIL